jgi:YggT family protein
MNAIVALISIVASLLFYLVLAYVIMSWLVGFNVINLQNQFVRQIYYGINNVVEPMLAPIRRILPTAGGIDFSPLVLLIGVEVLRIFILRDIIPALG